jgi:hypothetical protein
MTPLELLAAVRLRIQRKFSQAERAYVLQKTTKTTKNCQHQGRSLGDKIHACKILAMGEFEGDERKGANCCWDEKAVFCPLFTLKREREQVRLDFKRMSPKERAIRWPSLGELLRTEALIRQLDDLKGLDDGSIRQSTFKRSRNSFTDEDDTDGEDFFIERESRPSHEEEIKNSQEKDQRSNSGSTSGDGFSS